MSRTSTTKKERILPFRDAGNLRRPVAGAYNLGPKSTTWLAAIGVRSLDDVRSLGPIEVCRRLRARGFPVSVLMAYALEGALGGCHWNQLPAETKAFLTAEFAHMKRRLAADKKSARGPARSAGARRDVGRKIQSSKKLKPSKSAVT